MKYRRKAELGWRILHPSKAAVVRVIVNVAGAIAALLALPLGGVSIPGLAAALLVAGLFCHFATLDDGIRSLSICLVIGADRFGALSPPTNRALAVAAGSIIGVGVSWVYATTEAYAAAGKPANE